MPEGAVKGNRKIKYAERYSLQVTAFITRNRHSLWVVGSICSATAMATSSRGIFLRAIIEHISAFESVCVRIGAAHATFIAKKI